LKAAAGASLLLEAGEALSVGSELVGQHLEHHRTTEAGIVNMVDLAHAALIGEASDAAHTVRLRHTVDCSSSLEPGPSEEEGGCR
jgi:hypothetical protein